MRAFILTACLRSGYRINAEKTATENSGTNNVLKRDHMLRRRDFYKCHGTRVPKCDFIVGVLESNTVFGRTNIEVDSGADQK